MNFDGKNYQFYGEVEETSEQSFTSDCAPPGLGAQPLTKDTCSTVMSSGCTFDAGVCDCKTLIEFHARASGYYETTGTGIRFDGQSETMPYCVQGTSATVDRLVTAGRTRVQLRR